MLVFFLFQFLEFFLSAPILVSGIEDQTIYVDTPTHYYIPTNLYYDSINSPLQYKLSETSYDGITVTEVEMNRAVGSALDVDEYTSSASVTHSSVIQGDFLYTADGTSGMSIYDISNPENPVFLSRFKKESSPVTKICLDPTYRVAYMLISTKGVRAVDIRDKMNPISSSFFFFDSKTDWTYTACAINLNNNGLYITTNGSEHFGKMLVFDINDPYWFDFMDDYEDEGGNLQGYSDMVIFDETGYLALPNDDTIRIMDFDGLGDYYLVGSINTGTIEKKRVLHSYDSKFLFISERGGYLVYDVSNPEEPKLECSYSDGTNKIVKKIYTPSNTHVYITYDSAFVIFEITEENLCPTSFDENVFYIEDAVIGDEFTGSSFESNSSILSITMKNQGVRIYDVSKNLSHPEFTSVHPLTIRKPQNVELEDDMTFLYISDSKYGVHIINVTDVTHPVLTKTIWEDGIFVTFSTVVGNFLYVISGYDKIIYRYDVTNPSSPELDTQFQDESIFSTEMELWRNGFFDQNWGYITFKNTANGADGIHVFNITTSSISYNSSFSDYSEGEQTTNVFVSGDYLYVGGSTFRTYDIKEGYSRVNGLSAFPVNSAGLQVFDDEIAYTCLPDEDNNRFIGIVDPTDPIPSSLLYVLHVSDFDCTNKYFCSTTWEDVDNQENNQVHVLYIESSMIDNEISVVGHNYAYKFIKMRRNYLYLVNQGRLDVGEIWATNITVNAQKCGYHTISIDVKDRPSGTTEVLEFTIKAIKNGYYDLNCTVFKCNEVYSNQSSDSICSGYGSCVYDEYLESGRCICEKDFFGKNCEISMCNGLFSNDTENVCSGGKGNCYYDDDRSKALCNCSEPDLYFGDYCEDFMCYEYLKNDSSACSNGLGECIDHNKCKCKDDYFGLFCNMTRCNGILFNESTVCSSHGECIIENRTCNCTNPELYKGDYCQFWTCFEEINTDEELVCSGHGECIDFNKCDCKTSVYGGEDCSLWECFGISVGSVDKVCSSHGVCTDRDTCFCDHGYYSSEIYKQKGFEICDIWDCGIYVHNHTEVCNRRGECTRAQECTCRDKYEGKFCETWSCGYPKDNPNTCSGSGKCNGPSLCDCDVGWYGDNCEAEFISPIVATPLSLLAFGMINICIISLLCCSCSILLCVACFICCLFCFGCCQFVKVKKYSKLKNFDILLQEQELEKDETIAHLRMNKNLFEIKLSEIKIDEMIGEGGSLSTVFRAHWGNILVAFKCFKTRLICSSQIKFDDFEREVEVLSSVSHPNIVQFYGATVEVPRIGILMEFCEKGDLYQYLTNYYETNSRMYRLNQKIRMLHEVVLAMDYLHSRSIIHRDLKLENVLVDKKESCKLMDFGLSTIVDRMSQQKTTRIGTNLYMAPEVLSQNNYTEKCDVFSFGIFIYIFISENYEPYGKLVENVHLEVKVSTDPDFRPIIDEEFRKKYIPESLQWLEEIITNCWGHRSEERRSFGEMNLLFQEKRSENLWVEYPSQDINDGRLMENDDSKVIDLRNKFLEVKKNYEYLKSKLINLEN